MEVLPGRAPLPSAFECSQRGEQCAWVKGDEDYPGPTQGLETDQWGWRGNFTKKIQAENEVSDSLLVPTHSTLQAWLSMEVGHVHIYFTLYSYVTQGSVPRCMTRWNS